MAWMGPARSADSGYAGVAAGRMEMTAVNGWEAEAAGSRRTAGRLAWLAARALALLVGLLTLYLHAHTSTTDAIVGTGIAFVALSTLLSLSKLPSEHGLRLRVACDLALLYGLLSFAPGGVQSPLRHLLLLPLLDASLNLDLPELLAAALGSLLIALALALSAPDSGAPVWMELVMLCGELATAAAVVGFLVHDRRHRWHRDDAMERLLRQQRALSSLAAAMRRDVAFDRLAEIVLDAAREIEPYQAATLALLNDNGDRLEPVATRSYGPRPPVERVEAVNRGSSEGLFDGPPRVAVARSVDLNGCILQTPLVGDEDRIIGRLTLLSPLPPGAIEEADREALLALGQQAGTAWENAALRQALRRDSDGRAEAEGGAELTALVEASRALVAYDRREGLDEVLGKAIALVAGERGSLMLLDEDTGTLRIETATGLSEHVMQTARVPLGEKISGQVALTGEPRRLLEGGDRQGLRDSLCVPLRVRDKVIGVLNIANKRGPGVFTSRDLEVLSAMANQAAIAIRNSQLFGELQDLFLSTVSTLAKAVDAKDRYTAGHSHRVTLYALEIARELDLDDEARDLLRIAGLMHDVGKIGVPEAILRKPGPLTAEERVEMERHPVHGARIVEPIKQLHPILPGVRWHHERLDGLGYPDGLAGDAIPLQARILAVADAYDAMTSDRPYRSSLSTEVALAELQDGVDRQWAADLVAAFLTAHQAGRIEPLHAALPDD